jgi:sterol desaturase/sphingolipid hydroxylase (fatty acid hydroxylase superfamily)
VNSENNTASSTELGAQRFSLNVWRLSLAKLSRARLNARAGLVADTVIGVALLGAGLRQVGVATAAVTILCGLTLFSLVEYAFHRWLFHGYVELMAQGHRQHHENPAGYDALPFFVPPLAMLALAGVLATFAPTGIALLLTGALAAGYAAYGLGHTAIHSRRFRQRLTRRWAANHHIHHHHPDRNFGVTTPLWDIVLGTRYVPARHRTR